MIKSERKQWAFGLMAIFLLTHYGFDNLLWKNISVYYLYAFEFFFIFLTTLFLKSKIKWIGKLDLYEFKAMPLAALFGLLVFKTATSLGLPIPFDFSSVEIVFQLLIIAPILEELLYRLALWNCIEAFSSKPKVLIGFSTLLFSLGHFAAYFYVPADFKIFVIYQSVYVIFLSIWVSIGKLKTNRIQTPVLIHFMFNLGFYIATKL